MSIKAMRDARSMFALLVAIVLMFGITAVMGVIVARGWQTGETRLPLKQASLQRVVSKETEPAMFVTAMSIYALLGVGSASVALWGCREAWRLRVKSSYTH